MSVLCLKYSASEGIKLHLSPSPKGNTSVANSRLLSITFQESAMLCSKRADTNSILRETNPFLAVTIEDLLQYLEQF
jgi:hypothetical protein